VKKEKTDTLRKCKLAGKLITTQKVRMTWRGNALDICTAVLRKIAVLWT